MSVMDIFRGFRSGEGRTAEQQQPTAISQTNDPTKQVGPGSNGNQTVPGAGTVGSDGAVAALPITATGEASPLGKFGDLWDRKDTDKLPPGYVAPLAPDANAVRAAAAGADFTSKIDPALLAQAAKGDPTALAKVINAAATAGFAESALSTAQIVNSALEKTHQRYRDEIIPSVLRGNNVSNAVAEIPMADNPAVAPVFNMVKQQLMAKYPSATADQIAGLAKEYMGDMSRAFVTANGQQVTDIPKPSPGAREATDWDKYFTA